MNKIPKKIGLVLTGGGARGAYQAGALSALFEICARNNLEWPFKYLCGTSAGGINACFIASRAGNQNMMALSQELQDLWGGLHSSHVMDVNPMNLTTNGFQWVRSLSLGGVKTNKKSLSLLDNAPLKKLLTKYIDFKDVRRAIDGNVFEALSLSMVCYSTGISQTFFMGQENLPHWRRIKREGLHSELTHDHIMASSAIPLVFPSIKIGANYYGDGSLRDYTPLSPAIKLGADKLLIMGVRKRDQWGYYDPNPPTPAKIFSVILNGILLDALDTDLERLERINRTVSKIPEGMSELRIIENRVITPSRLLSTIAEQEIDSLPKTIRFFINGLGNAHEASDLISYILFEAPFTKRLLELGREDVFGQESDLLEFLTT